MFSKTVLLVIVGFAVFAQYNPTLASQIDAEPGAACGDAAVTPETSSTAEATPQTSAGGSVRYTLESTGVTRAYWLYLPESYDPTQPTPLVMSMHGFASSPQAQENSSQWNPVADEHGFLVIYPEGTGMPLRWNSYPIGNNFAAMTENPADDIQYLSDLIDHLAQNLCVDLARVYVTGLSNGAAMTVYAACELADRVAAIGTVAGAYVTRTDCEPSRPVPLMVFHGTADSIAPYEGGRVITGDTLLAVADAVFNWATKNGCMTEPETILAVGDVSGVYYTDCTANADVIFYTVDGGGHNWTGGGDRDNFIGGRVSMDVNASELMWAFFTSYSLDVEADS